MTTRVLENMERLSERKIKLWSISAVISKSAMTPFFSGRTATMEPGVRPIICLAWVPVATTRLVFTSTATTLGSRTIMRPLRSQIMVVAVPKSIPISLDKIICILSLSKTGGQCRRPLYKLSAIILYIKYKGNTTPKRQKIENS